jgi:TPR repeat protein
MTATDTRTFGYDAMGPKKRRSTSFADRSNANCDLSQHVPSSFHTAIVDALPRETILPHLIRTLLVAALFSLAVGTASAAPMDDGKAAAERGDYPAALKIIRPLAQQGDATAQLYLGVMYTSGLGVKRSEKEAAKWFRLSATQGNADAQCNLGVAYVSGQGVTQDFKLAVKWYRLSADQGNARAQFSLGVAYAGGIGVAKDQAEGAKWLRLAADQGEMHAQYQLGAAYHTAEGVALDEGESFKWFRLSALQGFADAQVTLALKYDQGSGIAEDSTHANMWYRLAAMEGNDHAPYFLSEIELRMTPEQIAQAKDMAARCKTSGYKDCD